MVDQSKHQGLPRAGLVLVSNEADQDGLIEKLTTATGPSRTLDFALARFAGWGVHSSLAEDGTRRDLWLAPPSMEPSRVPQFTSSLDSARGFVDTLLGEHVAAVTLQAPYRATIYGGPEAHGDSPSLALCLAALLAFRVE